MIKVGIFGDTGMVGQEIERVLKGHDRAGIAFRKNTRREEGDLGACDLVFLATRDPESMSFAPALLKAGKRVIDMSGAFRLPREPFEKWYHMAHTAPELLKEAVYGLPAYFQDQIAQARLVANPGCYPTSVVLALRPLKGLVQGAATIVSTSGNSGARREVETASNEITYGYGRKHKHVPEMELYSGFRVDFTPIVLRSVFRGINTNIKIELAEALKAVPEEEAVERLGRRLQESYQAEDLVTVVKDAPDREWGTADVVNTHGVLVKVRVDEGFAYICSMEDNLGKGAASQAVENMNLMAGLPRLHGIHEAYKTNS
jgi:N-acetyl-gamma-glutamyl-phosphate reductase